MLVRLSQRRVIKESRTVRAEDKCQAQTFGYNPGAISQPGGLSKTIAFPTLHSDEIDEGIVSGFSISGNTSAK